MKLYIYTLTNTLFDGPITSVSLPTAEGIITVLNGHAPIVSALKSGSIIVKADGKETSFPIKNGFAKISADSVIVLAEE